MQCKYFVSLRSYEATSKRHETKYRKVNFHADGEVRSIKRPSATKITGHRVLFQRDSRSPNFARYRSDGGVWYLPVTFGHVRRNGNFLDTPDVNRPAEVEFSMRSVAS